MDIWKGVMRLNAKAFCVLTVALLAGTAVWCGFRLLTPPNPFREGNEKAVRKSEPFILGTLSYVSNQIADTTSVIPVDPFRPTIEAIFTNETERTAFLRALKNTEIAKNGASLKNNLKVKKDPFSSLRGKSQIPGKAAGPDSLFMITPRIRYEGYIERPDGSKVTMFHDSTTRASVFYELGQKVHGVKILNANVKEATILFPDGTSRNLKLGGFVELAAEPAPPPPPKQVAPKVAGKVFPQPKKGAPRAARKVPAPAKKIRPPLKKL